MEDCEPYTETPLSMRALSVHADNHSYWDANAIPIDPRPLEADHITVSGGQGKLQLLQGNR
jgi:hypothetical protein